MSLEKFSVCAVRKNVIRTNVVDICAVRRNVIQTNVVGVYAVRTNVIRTNVVKACIFLRPTLLFQKNLSPQRKGYR